MEYLLILYSTSIYCFGAGESTLMSISDGLGPYIFHRRIEKTRRPLREEMDWKVFFPAINGIFPLQLI